MGFVKNSCTMYKEGNNRPSFVNLKPLVHINYKAGNKCYPLRQHGHSVIPKCVNMCSGIVHFTCCGHTAAVE